MLTTVGVPVDFSSSSPLPVNRRAGERLKLKLAMTCDGVRGQTLNISSSGLRYSVPRAVPPGSELDLCIRFRNSNIACKADVVWVERVGVSSIVGARFRNDDGSEQLSQAIAEIVDSTKRFFGKG